MKIIIASNNKGKINEFKRILPQYEVYSMEECGFELDSNENGSTFEQNALIKAQDLQKIVGDDYIVISDDSGIIVDALPNELGVFSARFSGDRNKETLNDSNNNLLLEKMKGVKNRDARYKCVICVIVHGKVYFTEGSMELEVADEIKKSGNGFAFDFVTKSKKYNKFVCELTDEEKDLISHRGLALHEVKRLLDTI